MFSRIYLLITLLVLSACGGGGGGESTNSDRGADSGVRILHGVLDLEPLSIKLADGKVLTEAEFAEVFRYFKLPEGNQTLQLFRRADALNAISEKTLNVNPNGKYSLLVFGNRSGLGTGTKILTDGFSGNIPEGKIAVRVIDATVGATTIDFSFNSANSGRVSFGSDSEYQIISLDPSSTLNFSATRSVDSRQVISQNLTLESGKSYSLFVAGEIGLYTLVRILQD